jgi:hypothetical protein
VHRLFAKRELRRRVIALVAAYAIALSSLIASFGAASAAAADAGSSGGIICHNAVGGQSSPVSNETNDKACADCCCVGCLMLMAALPRPPATAIAVTRPASEITHPEAIAVFPGAPDTKSHRSRAPPSAA